MSNESAPEEISGHGAAKRAGTGIHLLVLTPHEIPGRRVASFLRRARRTHFGLFPGFTGITPRGGQAAVAFHGVGDMMAYTAVRHLAHLLQPGLIVHVSMARAVAESVREADFVVVREAVPCWCPPALTHGMIGDAALLDAKGRAGSGPLGGATVAADPRVNAEVGSRMGCASALPAGCVLAVRAGSTADPLHGWFAREFVRTNFETDVTDHDSHGFLTACGAAAARGAAVRVIGENEGAEAEPLPAHAWKAVAETLALLPG